MWWDHWDWGRSGRRPQELRAKRKPTQDSLPLQGLRLRFETHLIFPLFLYSTLVKKRGWSLTGRAHAHSGARSAPATAWAVPLAPPTRTLGQPAALLSSGRAQGRPRTAGPQGRVWGGRLGRWAGGQVCRARLPGAWSTVLCRGLALPGTDPRWGPQAHLGHCLPLTPLPSQGRGCPRGGQMWPGPHPHLPFGPRHQQKEKGSWGRGRRPLARRGALLALGVHLYVCKLLGQPPAFPCRNPGLGPHEAAGWPSAAPGLAHSPELTPSLCVRLAGPG